MNSKNFKLYMKIFFVVVLVVSFVGIFNLLKQQDVKIKDISWVEKDYKVTTKFIIENNSAQSKNVNYDVSFYRRAAESKADNLDLVGVSNGSKEVLSNSSVKIEHEATVFGGHADKVSVIVKNIEE